MKKTRKVSRPRAKSLSGGNWHIVAVDGALRPARLESYLLTRSPKGSLAVFMLQHQPNLLLRELRHFVTELERGAGQRDTRAVVDAAADVANLALMVAEAAKHL